MSGRLLGQLLRGEIGSYSLNGRGWVLRRFDVDGRVYMEATCPTFGRGVFEVTPQMFAALRRGDTDQFVLLWRRAVTAMLVTGRNN